jgi:steroid 5-alpha reductase family enzyme
MLVEFIELAGVAAIAVFLFMTLLWSISVVKKNVSVVDIGWGLGFIVISFVTMFFNVSFVDRSYLLMAIVTLWGLRLAVHIYLRSQGRGEDWRYRGWREDWGDSFLWRSYLGIFLRQGVLILVISLPVIFVHYSASSETLSWTDMLGALLWFVGFVVEILADYQLTAFRARPSNKDRILTSGLWRYSRHPNYFGEAVQWWGIFFVALALPGGIFTIIGPLTITYLLLRVSGVPLLEKRYHGNSDYDRYKRVTSPFVPWFPKKTMGQRVGLGM